MDLRKLIKNKIQLKNLDEESFKEVIDKAKAYDKDAQQYLYNELYDLVKKYIKRKFSVEEDIDEIVQNTIICVYKKLSILKDYSAFRPWLYAIAKYEYFNSVKISQRRLNWYCNEEKNLSTIPCNQYKQPENIVEMRQNIKLVTKEMLSLPEINKKIFDLLINKNAKYKDIAKSTKLSYFAVNSRIYQVRKRLLSKFSSMKKMAV